MALHAAVRWSGVFYLWRVRGSAGSRRVERSGARDGEWHESCRPGGRRGVQPDAFANGRGVLLPLVCRPVPGTCPEAGIAVCPTRKRAGVALGFGDAFRRNRATAAEFACKCGERGYNMMLIEQSKLLGERG